MCKTNQEAVVKAVTKFMKDKTVWEGGATELLKSLGTSANVVRSLPAIPNHLSRALSNIDGTLKLAGITVTKKHSGVRTITLKKSSPILSKDPKEKYAERAQREFDKLYETYEAGIELAPGLFRISHFYANKMVMEVIKEEFGKNSNKRINLSCVDLDGVEVADGVTVVKIKGKYYLDYLYNNTIEEYLENWLNFFTNDKY